MKKRVLKIIDIIISLICMSYFLKLLGLTEPVDPLFGIGVLIQLFFMFPALIIFSVSIITMIISVFIKDDNDFFILSEGLKIVFYVLFIFGYVILGGKIKMDLLVIVPVMGVIGLLCLIISKKQKKKQNADIRKDNNTEGSSC